MEYFKSDKHNVHVCGCKALKSITLPKGAEVRLCNTTNMFVDCLSSEVPSWYNGVVFAKDTINAIVNSDMENSEKVRSIVALVDPDHYNSELVGYIEDDLTQCKEKH